MADLVGKIYLAGAFIIAGSSVVSVKFLSPYLGPFTIISAALLQALLASLPFSFGNLANGLKKIGAAQIILILLQAVFGVLLFRLFLLAGLDRTSAGEAGLLTGAVPAITALLAFFYLKEDLTRRHLAGLVCTVLGVAILQGLGRTGLSAEHLLGNGLILSAAACESIFNVISRQSWLNTGGTALNPMSRTTLVTAAALAFCLIPTWLENPLPALASLNRAGWLALIWQGLAVSLASYVFWFAGIKRCPASVAAAFTGLMPLAAVSLAAVFLGETMTGGQYLGGLGIIAGMYLISLSRVG